MAATYKPLGELEPKEQVVSTTDYNIGNGPNNQTTCENTIQRSWKDNLEDEYISSNISSIQSN